MARRERVAADFYCLLSGRICKLVENERAVGWAVRAAGGSSAGYCSGGGQPDRRALTEGGRMPRFVVGRCPRHDTVQPKSIAPWPNALNSGGLGAGPPTVRSGPGGA
jgi:hypothetical protein